MKGKYLNPKADMTFKLVFGEHPDLVMSLLNALLPQPEDGLIESVEYLTPEMVPENPTKEGQYRRRTMQGQAGSPVHCRNAALLERGVQAPCVAQCLKGYRAPIGQG